MIVLLHDRDPPPACGDDDLIGVKQRIHGVKFNDLPPWQKRGMGFYRIKEEKEGYNPLSGESVITLRSRIHTEMELPINDAYEELLIRLMDNAEAK